jgi:hypothetical protein
MTKTEEIRQWYYQRGEGAPVDTESIWRCAAEVGCAAGTVYRQIRWMKAEGLVEDGHYVTRKYIPAATLVKFLDSDYGTFISDKWYQQVAAALFSEQRWIYHCLTWAIQSGAITRLNGGSYGWLLRPNRAVAA